MTIEREGQLALPGADGWFRVAEMVARSRKAQGLPERITDPATLAQIAALLGRSVLYPVDAPRSVSARTSL